MVDDAKRDLLMKVDGMTCGACAAAVTRVIHGVDPAARVAVDLERGRVSVATRIESLEIARALTQAGYEASAMTG
jgi:copper chaperone